MAQNMSHMEAQQSLCFHDSFWWHLQQLTCHIHHEVLTSNWSYHFWTSFSRTIFITHDLLIRFITYVYVFWVTVCLLHGNLLFRNHLICFAVLLSIPLSIFTKNIIQTWFTVSLLFLCAQNWRCARCKSLYTELYVQNNGQSQWPPWTEIQRLHLRSFTRTRDFVQDHGQRQLDIFGKTGRRTTCVHICNIWHILN